MIQVSHLYKNYGNRTAIHDLNFEIQKGEIVGFLGPNGAGKSTTMKIITGLLPATSGTASVCGYDVFENPMEVKRHVGYLPENPPVYHDMIVEDYLKFVSHIHQVDPATISKRVSWALEKTSLGDVRKRIIGNLSKGFKQRVGLAQALVHNPAVLVLDEPTVGLDPKQIIEIRELIKSLAGDHTIILSSHILPEITATCHRVIVISKGKIVAEDSIEQLTARTTQGQAYSMIVKQVSENALHKLKQLPGMLNVSAIGNKITLSIKPGTQDIRDQMVKSQQYRQ
jgi:ABC-2 type transport system ATP-binding protein